MSRASVWASLVATTKVTTEDTEAQRPPGLSVGGLTVEVNRAGGLNLSGPTSADLTVDEVTALRDWIVATFG